MQFKEKTKEEDKMKNVGRNIRVAIGCMILVGIVAVWGSEISAEATEYGTLISGANGTCGATGNESNITWAFYDSNEDGDGIANKKDTLVFKGSGEMKNWTKAADVPWASYKENLKTVIFAEGSQITNIGDYAFGNCDSLSSISISSGVTSIGEHVFRGCEGLESVSIPSEVRGIGLSAFYGCSNLSSVIFEEGSQLTSIGHCVFTLCSKLSSIDIPSGVTSIGEKVFLNCTSLESVSIPSGVKIIYIGTFMGCSKLESVSIPSGVTEIKSRTFYGCSKLNSLIIPSSVESIGSEAFKDCGVKEIFYPQGLSFSGTELPTEISKISYTVNDTDGMERISVLVEAVSGDNINLPKEIDGKKISSISWDNSIDKSQISVTCGTHYPTSGNWKKDTQEHWFTECCLCDQTVNIKEVHKFSGGTRECECGYKPFDITTHPQGKTWVYGTKSEEEREISVEVVKTLGGEILTYQWYNNGNIIAGATESTYVVPEEVHSSDYHCKVTCGEYSIDSSPAEISVTKAQSLIYVEEGKENITLIYGNEGLQIEGVTKTGEGRFVYEVTEGADVLSVSSSGKIIPLWVGTATISVNMPETANYKPAETKIITVTIEKADYPVTTPDTPVSVENTVKTVSEVSLADKWQWDSEDTNKTLPAGKDLEVTANYVGEDKGCYNNISIKVTLKRAACTSSDILYTGEGDKVPSCTTEGKGHKECTVCGDILEEDITVPVLKHTLSKVAKTEATCTAEGKKEHWQCGECKKLFSDEQGENEVTVTSLIVPTISHTGGVADCTKKAVCTICKKEYGELNKNKHGETEVKNAKEATCTEKGYTGDVYCKACDEIISAGEEKKSLGHTGGVADCTRKAVCNICKKEYGELDKSKHGETEVKNAKEATCKENGYTGDSYCKGCGEKILAGKEISITGHTGGVATCTKKAVCDSCKQEYGELDKKNHVKTEVKNAKEATCEEKGYTGDTYCKDCGETVSVGKEVVSLGHKLSKVEKIEATCNTYGKEAHWSCSTCKKLFLDEQGSKEVIDTSLIIPKTNHVGEKELKNVRKSTCKEEGYTGDWHCKDCGEIISTGKITEKLAHTWDKGIVTKEAAETEKGIKIYTCSVCQETKTEEIPETGKVVTPEKPGKVTPAPTVTLKPTEKPSKEEQRTPKKGTILTDKKSNGKYKILVSGTKNGTVEYVKPLSKKSIKANVPATVKLNGITYKVVSIAKNAFKNHKAINKVTIGKNVKTIGANAFYGCKKLKTVSMGKNVTSIGEKAFYKCTALTKITLPSKVKKIGKQSFYGCKKLKNITIKTTKLTKKNVGSKAFTGVNKKAAVKVPAKKVKSYQKLLKSKGISKTVTVKK